jgi:hypothetical protein
MKGASRLRDVLLLSLVICALNGCHWGGPHAKTKEVSVLHGLSTLDFDGVLLRLKRDTADVTGLVLIVAGQATNEAALRPGDRFTLTDGRGVYETYQLLVVGPERVMLKRQISVDRRASGAGIRTVEDVIAVTPYDLHESG